MLSVVSRGVPIDVSSVSVYSRLILAAYSKAVSFLLLLRTPHSYTMRYCIKHPLFSWIQPLIFVWLYKVIQFSFLALCVYFCIGCNWDFDLTWLLYKIVRRTFVRSFIYISIPIFYIHVLSFLFGHRNHVPVLYVHLRT